MAFNNVYFDKKVLVTGHTGFKGSWLVTWLISLGAKVYGYSDGIPTQPSMFNALGLEDKVLSKYANIQDVDTFSQYVHEVKPDFIFHLAAQAIVSTSYRDPMQTIITNVIGTAAVLDVLRNVNWECTCVIITSDKVYENVEWIWGYRENDAVGGHDIYSGSKGATELIIRSYWHSFVVNNANVRLGIARAGNVIGGGDWASDRIVVDCIKAFSNKKSVELRNPHATRPWQHVLEPLSGYLNLGQVLFESPNLNGEAFNFGPKAEQLKTVENLTKDIANAWNLDPERYVIRTSEQLFKEATLLKLNCDKALAYMEWHSTLDYFECVELLVNWYRKYYEGAPIENMYELTNDQIDFYCKRARLLNLKWML